MPSLQDKVTDANQRNGLIGIDVLEISYEEVTYVGLGKWNIIRSDICEGKFNL